MGGLGSFCRHCGVWLCSSFEECRENAEKALGAGLKIRVGRVFLLADSNGFPFFWLLDFHLRRGSSESLLHKDATRIKEFGGGVKRSSREGALNVQTRLLSRAATVIEGAAHGLIIFAPHSLNLGLWNGQQGGE